jgi:single-stranded-DNA-specific exonuclease
MALRMTTAQKRWVMTEPEPARTRKLADTLHVPLPVAQVLVNRGYPHAAEADRFLNPRLRQLGDPFALPDMDAAVDRLLAAIERRERIVIYGDYDVDGVTSSALLVRVLRGAGADPGNFLPHRMDEGYGLSPDGIARCLNEHQPRLLVAVDCGTGSVREIADLRKRGVDTIVLDHHEPPAALPECVALVNPKLVGRASRPSRSESTDRQDACPTWRSLASVGVAFKFAHGLLKRQRRLAATIDLRDHLDLAAVGTVADVVPLTGDNRILVRSGLERLPRTAKVGLRALLDVADVPDRVSPYHIGFRIGPRLNAAGRLADAMAALELLLTEDGARAAELARLLDAHNAERQQIEERITAEALAQAQQHESDRVLVLADPGWHPGVIGIVASRIAQQYYRPTVIVGRDGKGSCRSISGFSIVDALSRCASALERFGGHDMAAGLTVEPKNVARLRRLLNEHAGRVLDEEDFQPRIHIDAVVRLDEMDDEFFRRLEQLEPCGPENPEPTFAALGVRLRGTPRVVGADHLKFFVLDPGTGAGAEAVWWKMAEHELPRGPMDVAFNAELHEYRGEQTVQLKVRDVRASERGSV